jgi:hypothetical protein
VCFRAVTFSFTPINYFLWKASYNLGVGGVAVEVVPEGTEFSFKTVNRRITPLQRLPTYISPAF